MESTTAVAAVRGQVSAPALLHHAVVPSEIPPDDPRAIGIIEVARAPEYAEVMRKVWRLDAVDANGNPRHHPTREVGTWRDGEKPSPNCGKWSDEGVQSFTIHFYEERRIDALSDWVGVFDTLAGDPTKCLPMGRLMPGKRDRKFRDQWRVERRSKQHYGDVASVWFVLDLDGVALDCPLAIASREDIVDAIERCIALDLPDFANASFVCSLTSSAGIKSANELRCRLVFELAAPAMLREKLAVVEMARAVAKSGGRKPAFDDAIYSPADFIFTAAPRLYARTEAGDVTMPRPGSGTWYVDRDNDTVSLQLPQLQQRSDTIGIVPWLETGAFAGTKIEVADRLQAIGNGPGSYHNPTLQLIGSLAVRTPAHDVEAVMARHKALVRERIIATSEPGELENRLATHLDDTWWRQSWRETVEWRNNKLRRPAPVVPVQVVADQGSRPPPIADARAALAVNVGAKADALECGSKAHVLVKAPPGFGKTHALKAVLTQARLTNSRIGIYVPTHKLAEQLSADARGWATEMRPGPGELSVEELQSRIRHHKGRTQPGMCPDDVFRPRAERAEALGLSPKKHVCGDCPTGKAGACPWLAQDADTGNGVIVRAHATMLRDIDEGNGWASLYVIDEGAHGTFIGVKRQTSGKTLLTDLDPGARAVRKKRGKRAVYSGGVRYKESADLRQYRETLIAALGAAIPAEKHKQGRVPTSALTQFFATTTWRQKQSDGLVTDRTDKVLEHALWLETEHRAALATEILAARDGQSDYVKNMQRQHALSHDSTRILEAIRASEAREYVFGLRVYRAGAGKGVGRVWCQARTDVPSDIRARGALWLDGTASEAVFQAMLSRDGTQINLDVIDATAQVGAVHVTQHNDRTYSRAMFVSGDDEALDDLIDDDDEAAEVNRKAHAANALPAWMRAAAGAPDFAAEATRFKTRANAGRALKAHRKMRADSNINQLWRYVLEAALPMLEAWRVAPGPNDGAAKMQHAVLLVAQKAVIEALERMKLPANVCTAHFNALRGLNAFKHVPCAIVVGRPALGNGELETLAEALHMHNPTVREILRANDWGVAEIAIDATQGAQIIKTEAHPDPFCRELASVLTTAEVKQGVARIRPYDRTASNPCRVFVFGRHASGLPVDAFGTWESAQRGWQDIAKAAGAIFERPETNQLVYGGLIAASGRKGAAADEHRGAWLEALCADHEPVRNLSLYLHNNNRERKNDLSIGDIGTNRTDSATALRSGLALAEFRVCRPGRHHAKYEHALLSPHMTTARLERMTAHPIADFRWLDASGVNELLDTALSKALARCAGGDGPHPQRARQCVERAADRWAFAREVLGWAV